MLAEGYEKPARYENPVLTVSQSPKLNDNGPVVCPLIPMYEPRSRMGGSAFGGAFVGGQLACGLPFGSGFSYSAELHVGSTSRD